MSEVTERRPGSLAELFLYNRERPIPKAFAVTFADLERWDPLSFHEIAWGWPDDQLTPIGSVLRRRKSRVDTDDRPFETLQPVTIHFDGSVSKRALDPGRTYTMNVYDALPGDVVVAKIDLKNGAVGIVPDDWHDVVFTSHFAVYEPDRSRLLPEYLTLIVQARFFKRHLWRNKVGAEGRKEVKLDFFESLRIPIPGLDVQADIVDRWRRAKAEAAALNQKADGAEATAADAVYDALGTDPPSLSAPLPKVMAVPSAEFDRWTFFYLARKQAGLVGFETSRYPIQTLGDLGAETANGRSISPTTQPTPYRVLKLSALQPAGLDTTKAKPVLTDEETAERFSVEVGDLLLCRSNSFEYVAKSAVVEDADPTLIFPDIMIRVTLPDGLRPRYVREVIETPLGRSYFQTQARRAAGAMWKIGADDIASFPIPVPPVDVQDAIIAAVDERRTHAADLRQRARQRLADARAEVEDMILGPN